MKALTLWQPWASLVIAGAKPYEFRSWRPPASLIGQRIVIHAAARKVDREEACWLWTLLMDRHHSEQERIAAAETCLHADIAIPILERGFMDGLEPLPPRRRPRHRDRRRTAPRHPHRRRIRRPPRANDSDRDSHANLGWPMLDIEPWPEPIPMRGKQGLWNWPDPADFIGDLS
ncbi:ASCH domain-containing protein [Novosphingobium colocasiae]